MRGIIDDMIVMSLRSASWLSHLAMLQNMMDMVLLWKLKARSRLVLFSPCILHWMCLASSSGEWQPKRLESGHRAWEGKQEYGYHLYLQPGVYVLINNSISSYSGRLTSLRATACSPDWFQVTGGYLNHSLPHWLVTVQIGTVQARHLYIFTQLKQWA